MTPTQYSPSFMEHATNSTIFFNLSSSPLLLTTENTFLYNTLSPQQPFLILRPPDFCITKSFLCVFLWFLNRYVVLPSSPSSLIRPCLVCSVLWKCMSILHLNCRCHMFRLLFGFCVKILFVISLSSIRRT